MSTSAPVVSSSSAGMQRGGRSRSETLRLGHGRVVRLRAVCVTLRFCEEPVGPVGCRRGRME